MTMARQNSKALPPLRVDDQPAQSRMFNLPLYHFEKY